MTGRWLMQLIERKKTTADPFKLFKPIVYVTIHPLCRDMVNMSFIRVWFHRTVKYSWYKSCWFQRALATASSWMKNNALPWPFSTSETRLPPTSILAEGKDNGPEVLLCICQFYRWYSSQLNENPSLTFIKRQMIYSKLFFFSGIIVWREPVSPLNLYYQPVSRRRHSFVISFIKMPLFKGFSETTTLI